ncbi:MAG: hypothetical protein JNJ57_11990, partial [Saprospiraceae bacterium]|nr:hypothetical protein [Saprospiraceae bacterium]
MTRILLFAFLVGIQTTAWSIHPTGFFPKTIFIAAPDTLDPPSCTTAPDVSVSCENFDPTLSIYPGIVDQSPNVVSVTQALNYNSFDTLCNRGLIVRTFTVFDDEGESGTCSQNISVNYLQDYFIRFPDDVFTTTCPTPWTFGEPTFFKEDCELIAATYEDSEITVVPDACFIIERNWTVINWCTYNPALPVINIPNPNPNAVTNHPSNLPGPIVSSIQTPGDPWRATVVKVTPSDPASTDYATFYNPNANGYRYTQKIKVLDTTDPQVINPPADPFVAADSSNNDPLLWNAMYWWDNIHQSHNLNEGEVDLSITATDDCGGSNINIAYSLFLDLDGDGVMETVVHSNQLGNQPGGLGWNNVMYNNVSNGQGQARQFDFRPVPTNQKWGFALEWTVANNQKTAYVRFNTFQAQNTFIKPHLPHGVHKIKWYITDGCGNETVREHVIIVRDTKVPEVICINGLETNLMPTGLNILWTSDLLQYAADNSTESQFLRYGVRKTGTGTGFPVDAQGYPISSITFNCNDVGDNIVELWCIDLAGNATYCETMVTINDPNDICDPNGILVDGFLKTETGDCIEEVTMWLKGESSFAPPFAYSFVADCFYEIPNSIFPIPLTWNTILYPEKNGNPLNGVTTYDIVLIHRHILGLEPLASPYKILAADVNLSGSITNFDKIWIRQLILGITQAFPHGKSWGFVLKEYQFPNPFNPFSPTPPYETTLQNLTTQPYSGDFVGYKLGDVNNSTVCCAHQPTATRHAGEIPILLETNTGQHFLQKNDEISLHFKQNDAASLGHQFTLELPGLELLEIIPEGEMTPEHFAYFPDRHALTTAWEIGGPSKFSLKCRATQSGHLPELLGLSSRITRAEAYAGAPVQRYTPVLQFPVSEKLELYQNVPNPFNQQTEIRFNLPQAGEVVLEVFDAEGRLLHRESGMFEQGMQRFSLNSQKLPATGVIYYQVTSAGE